MDEIAKTKKDRPYNKGPLTEESSFLAGFHSGTDKSSQDKILQPYRLKNI
jgi:hypothetical protein